MASAAPPAAAGRASQPCGPTTSNNYMTRLPGLDPGHIIAGGHVLAALAVASVCAAAAAAGDDAALPLSARVFFTLAVAARAILLRERLVAPPGAPPSAPEMSLGAAALFIANAAAGVATLAAPDALLPLIAYAVLDVVANWLAMVAAVQARAAPGSRGRALLAFFVSLACDLHVCALMARAAEAVRLTWPAFVAKNALNAAVMLESASVVLDRDAKAAMAQAAAADADAEALKKTE